MKCAKAITGAGMEQYESLNVNPDSKPAWEKKGILHKDCSSAGEPERCLECATVCECCADVCPNRANIVVHADGRPQIIHIDSMCNECGNCEAFCPYSSAPNLDKLTLFDSEEDFNNSKNAGFLPQPDNAVQVRLEGKTALHQTAENLPTEIWQLIQATLKRP